MAVEFYIAVLVMYCMAGWCTIRLYSHMGYFIRFSGYWRWVVWTLVFSLWPGALPLFVEAFGQMIREEN